MGNSFNKDSLKLKSKMGANRINLQTKKMEQALYNDKREIAILVKQDKVSKARIKVEGIIREEYRMDVYDLLGNFCEMIHQRAQFLASEKECPEDLLETLCAVLYAAPRCDIKELGELAEMFSAKYGKKFIDTYRENKSGHVPPRIVKGLSTAPPAFDLVVEKLKEICRTHDVDFDETSIANEFTNEIGAVVAENTAKVDHEKVKTLVRYLMDPSTFDLTDQQKHDLCRTNGGTPAECASAVHIANTQIQQQQSVQQAPVRSSISNQACEYTVTFHSRPFGMQWTETNDKQNLYVSSVDHGLLAHSLGVTQGSLIIAVNGRVVENMGAAQVFQISKAQTLPLSLTFRAMTNVVAQPPNIIAPAAVQPSQPFQPDRIMPHQPPAYPGPPGGDSDDFAIALPDPPGIAEPGQTAQPGEGPADYDDLEARFAALRS